MVKTLVEEEEETVVERIQKKGSYLKGLLLKRTLTKGLLLKKKDLPKRTLSEKGLLLTLKSKGREITLALYTDDTSVGGRRGGGGRGGR